MEELYIAKVKKWVEQWVIALDLCPFASHPFNNDCIRYVVIPFDDPSEFLESIHLEYVHLNTSDSENTATTIVVVSKGLEDFLSYLDVLETCNVQLEESGLDEFVQLASFHPEYQFAGTHPHDASNYTNRSPYPLIHLLKTEEVELAIENHENTESIPVTNIRKMEKMGLTEIKRALKELE